MYCPSCKTPNPAWNTRCSKCGNDLSNVKTPEDPPLYLVGSIASGLLAALLIWLVFFRHSAQSSPSVAVGKGIGLLIGCTFLLYQKYKRAKESELHMPTVTNHPAEEVTSAMPSKEEVPPPFSLGRLFFQWETQRHLPEHDGEGFFVFYLWRFLVIFAAIAGYSVCQLGFPVLAVVIDHRWPSLSSQQMAIIVAGLIALGFVSGFLLAKVLDSILLRIERSFSVPKRNT